MGWNSEEKKRTLVTDGNWTLVELPWDPEHHKFVTSRSRYVSLIKHKCYPKNRGRSTGQINCVVTYPDDSDTCWRCDVPIPEKIIVLWTFQNWDATGRRNRKRDFDEG
jgi:hypothetical protein